MSKQMVHQTGAHRNGKNWLFYTPPPEGQDYGVKNAIRNEASGMGSDALEAPLEPDAEEQTNLAASFNNPIGRPVDMHISQHPSSYMLGSVVESHDIRKLTSKEAKFQHHQLRYSDGEGSKTLTMAPSVEASPASTKLTKERSALARTHLSGGKISKPHQLTSMLADRQPVSKVVDRCARALEEAPSTQSAAYTTNKEQSSRARSASERSNTTKSLLCKTVLPNKFKSPETVVSGSESDEITVTGPSKNSRHIKHVDSRFSGSKLLSTSPAQRKHVSSNNMNRQGAAIKRKAPSPLKLRSKAKRPKRAGPFDDESNSDAISGSEKVRSDDDDSNARMSDPEDDNEDEWGPILVSPAPTRTPTGMNRAAPSPAPQPTKVVDVARLRRLLAENTKKQIESRGPSVNALIGKAGSTTKAEARPSHAQASMRASQNTQATADNVLRRSVLKAQHRGESHVGLKRSDTQPALRAALNANVGSVKANTASFRPVNAASASTSTSMKPISEGVRSLDDGKTSLGSPALTQSATKKAVGNATITEKLPATAPKSDRRLVSTPIARSRGGVRPAAKTGLVGSLIQGIRKSDQPCEAKAKSKSASISAQVSEHKSDARALEDASVVSRTSRAQAEQTTQGGKPPEQSRRRVLPDQRSHLAGSTLNANKALNLESVGIQGSASQLGTRSLNDNGHNTRVDVSKAPKSSSVSTTLRRNVDEAANDSIERAIPNTTPATSRTQRKLAAASAVGSQAVPRPAKVSNAFSRIAGSAAMKKFRQANANSLSINASMPMPQNSDQTITGTQATKAQPSADHNLTQASKSRVQLPRDAPSSTEKSVFIGAYDADSSNLAGDIAKVSQIEAGTKAAAARKSAVHYEVPTARLQSHVHVISADAASSQVPTSVSQPHSTQAALTEAEMVRPSTTRTSNIPSKPASSLGLDTTVCWKAGHDSALSPANNVPGPKLLPTTAAKTVAAIFETQKPSGAGASRNVRVPSSSSARVPVTVAITNTGTMSNAPSLGQGSKPTHRANDKSSDAQDHSQKSLGEREEERIKSADGESRKAKSSTAADLPKATLEPNIKPVPESSQVEVDPGLTRKTSVLVMERGPRADTPNSSTAPVFILSNSVPPADAEPYFEFCVFQKIWSDAEDESSVTATELSIHPSTNIEEVNSQAERLFHNLQKEYQQHFQVHFTDWSNKRDDHGCNVLVGIFSPVDYPKKQSQVKIWVQRDHVSAHASQAATSLKNTSFISKTLYVIRLFKLLPSCEIIDSATDSSHDSDEPDGSGGSVRAVTRVYHPHSRTECYTTLDAANRAAKSLQVELSHKFNPNAMDKVWQEKNLVELNRKTDELEEAKIEEGRYWRSEFNGSGLGSATFELSVEKVGLCGPRNL